MLNRIGCFVSLKKNVLDDETGPTYDIDKSEKEEMQADHVIVLRK